MIHTYHRDQGLATDATADSLVGALWVDLRDIDDREEVMVEKHFGIDVPTRDEMREIEASSRVYEEDDAIFLTATVLAQSESETPESAPITFILCKGTLITLRYSNPRPFETFTRRLAHNRHPYDTSGDLLFGLLEVIVDRIADIVEKIDASVGGISQQIFRERPQDSDLREVIRRIGRQGELNSHARESLMTLARVVAYLISVSSDDNIRARGKSAVRDIQSLTDHVSFIVNKINFLLDATLGIISIQQNGTIKIFSVVAVVFLPPTLIASIYGMNFMHMPELSWKLGYPMAMLMMIASAILPWWLFKRKGWL